jgi:hypothetical protein
MNNQLMFGFYSEGDFRSNKLKVYTTQYRLFGLQDLNQTYDQSQIHMINKKKINAKTKLTKLLVAERVKGLFTEYNLFCSAAMNHLQDLIQNTIHLVKKTSILIVGNGIKLSYWVYR